MKNIKACLSHNTDNWRTPSWLYSQIVYDFGYKDLFPYMADYDQFNILYKNEKLFINPPFSRLKDIPSYIDKLLKGGCSIWLLIPSRTDTIYFHKLLEYHPTLYFIKGRLHFNDSKKVAPFPTMLLHFGPFDIFNFYFSYEPSNKDKVR